MIPCFRSSVEVSSVEKVDGKGEKAGNQHVLLFLQVYMTYRREIPLSLTHLFFLCAKTSDSNYILNLSYVQKKIRFL